MSEKWFVAILTLCIIGVTIIEPRHLATFQRLWVRDMSVAGEQLALVNRILTDSLRATRDTAPAPSATARYEPAFVYSRYPFNFKNEFLVSIGSARGVREGAVAVIPAGLVTPRDPASPTLILIGKVVKVMPDTALVQTIFDPDFEYAVRIGTAAVDALLVGGATPRLTLIPKTTTVTQGDVVYGAAPSGDYGIAVGEARNVRLADDGLFQEADLFLGYDIGALRTILIDTAEGRK